jgi:hypothetical protein
MITKLIASCVMISGALLQCGTAFAAKVGTVVPPSVLNPIPGVDPPITFTFDIGGNVGFGTLMTTDMGGGQFWATSGTLTVTAGLDAGSYSIVPGGPSQTTSSLGAFFYDNLVIPASDPALDMNGLLFSNGSKEINIWGNSPGNYSFWDAISNGSGGFTYGVQYTGPGTFIATVLPISPVPLPASLWLMLSGIGAFAVLGRRQKRTASAL